MAMDGSCMDVADEAVNAKHFGYRVRRAARASSRRRVCSGWSKAARTPWWPRAYASYGHSEVAMAAELLPTKLTGDMPVMADRNLYSFKPWHEASASGAGLLWRAKSNLGLPVQHELADGSYLSTVFDIDDKRQQNGRQVQVIDYTHEDPSAPVQGSYRLVTNLLDPGGGTGAGVGGAVPRALGD